MTDLATDSWTRWQERISEHFKEHALLPTPTTEGIEIPFDVASECWMVADMRPDELPSLCRLTSAMGSPVERAAVILFLADLRTDQPYLRLPEDEEADRRAAIEKLFRDAVCLLPVDEIDVPWRVRWELPFAAIAGIWPRVTALIQRWIALAPNEETQALTSLARINFLSVHPARTDDWVSDWWSPYEGSQYSHVGELLAALFASRLDARTRLDSTGWSFPKEISDEQFGRVLDAENAIVGLRRPIDSLSASGRLVSAWCTAVAAARLDNIDRLREAAHRYGRLARDPDLPAPLFETQDSKSRRLPAWSAAMLFRSAGDLDSAREMAVFWTSVDGDSAEAWKFRAELERQLGLEVWGDSYERYVQLSPETETSWEHSELLRLLLESRDQNAADRALRALAFDHADRPVVEEMLSWDWSTYPQLDQSTRERWWDGLVFVCDGRVRAAFRRAPWRYAAACFGEAVALELRARVFAPLAVTSEFQSQRLSDREGRLANAILSSKATLGGMVEALNLASTPGSDLGRVIDRFLTQKHRPLRAHFRSKQAVARLRAATDSRNEAVHGDITPEEAKQVYSEARAFLDMLIKADPRPASV
jgi:hypothetical protein